MRSTTVATVAAVVVVTAAAAAVFAQSGQPSSKPNPAHAQHATGDAQAQLQDLANQIVSLRAQIAQLQATLAKGHSAGPPQGQPPVGSGAGSMGRRPPQGGSMQGMSGMPGGASSGMGMMNMMGGGGMSGMSEHGKGGMSGMMGMGDMPMGGMGSPAAAAMPTALPGFPGASKIYHIGSTGFFLDHPEHITLTLDQQMALSQRKEQALLHQAELQRKIEQAEQELWLLTGADRPDASAIDTKVREIAKLQTDQRVAFIRAVGQAAGVLTDEQRKQLTGMLPADPTPMPGMQPMPDM